MHKKLKLFSLLAVIFIGTFAVANRLFFFAANATYVEGHITQDTTWTLVDSPFIVSKDVIVDPNVILTIEPGVEVRFGGNFSLIIEGSLSAVGTQNRPITFTSNSNSSQRGDWETILFNGTTPSTMAYCLVKYGTDGITVQNSKLTITNSEVSDNSLNGITIANSQVTVENSKISNNLAAGISITGDNQVTIQDNTLRANADGILLTGNSTSGVNLRQNLVLLNTVSGIQLGSGAYSNLVIWNNTVSSNNYGFYVSGIASTFISDNSISYNTIGVYYYSGENHEAHFNDIYGNEVGMDVGLEVNVNATHNYWGDPSGPYHKSLNPNGKGNTVGGDGVNLDFIFFLTAPISHINQRPTANLLSDVKTVRPNQEVTFFATTSSDDGHVDQYFINFGDGKNSSWTTLSVYVHKYSTTGTFYATVTVMDDFGVRSTNVATVRIDIQDIASSLKVSLSSGLVVGSENQLPITIRATDLSSGNPVANANITLFSITGGSFTPYSGLTNSTGYVTASFTAPNVTEKTYVRLNARATKAGFADGSDFEYLEVLPVLMVEVSTQSVTVKSQAVSNVTVYVTHNWKPIVNATVTLSSDGGGSFEPATGTTNVNGSAAFSFTAPQVTSQLNVTITATAEKTDYYNGANQTKMTVNPRLLTVTVTANPSYVESMTTSNMIVHVTEDGENIADAVITVSSDIADGNFSATSGSTDSNGDFIFTFTTPETATQINVTVTASAAKTGYVDGENQTKVTVYPVPGPEPTIVLGLPWTTILLIVIPIVVVAIVAVLIKAKIIVISREQE